MGARPGTRLFLLLQTLALAALSAALLFALGLPLLAGRALSAKAYVVLVAADTVLLAVAGTVLLWRTVARPVERLLSAAERLGSRADLPILGEPEGLALSRAALAFERLAGELVEERAQLAAKVDELTRANRELAEARESLVRTEKLATVGRLAAGVAHEVGNPLGAISGYVDLLRSRLPPEASPEVRDWLERIAGEAGRIDRTVRDLLDFARPAKASLAPIDLRAALDGSLRIARVQSRFRGVEVSAHLPEGLPRVLADEHQLAQVLVNLFLNAGDAQQGAGGLRLEAHAEPGRVMLTLADGGPGIPLEDLQQVFDPFFTTKEPGHGTGLGLAICHRIMESFGGEISAGNAPGGGAVFTLVFRAASSQAGGPPARAGHDP